MQFLDGKVMWFNKLKYYYCKVYENEIKKKILLEYSKVFCIPKYFFSFREK